MIAAKYVTSKKLDNLERMLYATKVEIRNVPQQPGECRKDLRSIVLETAKVLDTPIERHDIKDVFRAGKKDEKSIIIVDFFSSDTKETFIRKSRQFNLENKDKKLNTTHLKLNGLPQTNFNSEKLTPKAQKMYYLARNIAKENS